MLESAVLFPHPPIVFPEVGGQEAGKVQETYQAMQKLAREIAEINPELIVAITPHGHVFADAVAITALTDLRGSLANFGAPQVKVAFTLDKEAVESIIKECQGAPFYCAKLEEHTLREYKRSPELDHGLVVPLAFVERAGWKGQLVPVNVGFLPYEELYHFGVLLRKALEKLGRKWVLLISGDMSHRLLPGGVHGYSPQGAVFDEVIKQALVEGDVKRVFSLDPDLIEEAGECSLRPIIMSLGALDGYNFSGQELSYEGPFGVGYLVAGLKPTRQNDQRLLAKELYKIRAQKLEEQQNKESEVVKLARQSIAYYVEHHKILQGEHVNPEFLGQKAGSFVSLKKNGQLRGCIGTVEPTKENLALEIIQNAVSAAIRDPRFEPLEPEELDSVTITVDVLEEPEKIDSLSQLDTKVYGVIVRQGRRQGLLLPDLPGIDNPAEQVRIAKQKAGIKPENDVELERFRVSRYY